MAANTRVFPPKSAILREGDQPTMVYRLVSGRASSWRTLPSGQTQLVAILLRGDVVGITNLLGDSLRDSIEARTAVAVQSISHARLLQLASDDSNVALWIIAHAIREEVRIKKWLTVLSHGTALEKIAVMLLNICERMGHELQRDGMPIRIALTQREISSHVGLTLPYVSRTLAALRRRGVVSIRHGSIEIAEPRLLAAAAQNMVDAIERNPDERAAVPFGRGPQLDSAERVGRRTGDSPNRMREPVPALFACAGDWNLSESHEP